MEFSGQKIFFKREDKFQSIRKQLSFEQFKLYFDPRVLKEPTDYLAYCKHGEFQEIFNLKMVLLLDINPFNKKDTIHPPIYQLSTNIQEIKLGLTSTIIASISQFTETMK